MAPELPPVVRSFAKGAGGRIAGPRVIRFRHEAFLSTSQGRPPIAITADQWLNTRTPGLVWRAVGSVSGAPVVVVRALLDLAPPKASVLRDGKEVEIATSEVVLGDIVVLPPAKSFRSMAR